MPREYAVAGDEPNTDAAFAKHRHAELCLQRFHDRSLDSSPRSRCENTSEHYSLERERWLGVAADADNVHAIRVLAAQAGADPEGMKILTRAWRVGFIPALGRLADHYFENSVPSNATQSSGRVLGFAHLWLQAHLQDVAAGGGRREYVAQLYEKLNTRRLGMSLEETELALQLAKDMLKRNDKCCFGP